MRTTLIIFSLGVFFSAIGHAELLTLEQAVNRAQMNDAWLASSRHREEAFNAQSTAAGELPDPGISLGVRNVPQDSFSLGQEPMTQVTLGISQLFPRGDTRRLSRERFLELGAIEPQQRENRRAILQRDVSQLWFDAFFANRAIHLIEKDRALFEHLVDVSESAYSTALGKTRQHDVIRAQLELSRLEDRLITLTENFDHRVGELAQWVGFDGTSSWLTDLAFKFPDELPLMGHNFDESLLEGKSDHKLVESYLTHHPAVRALDEKIGASQTAIELAKQSYKPQWGVSAGYGYRKDSVVDRDDFLSVGVSFDLPIFPAKRQDQNVRSATALSESLKTDRVLILRELWSGLEASRARYKRLAERKKLFTDRLLIEMEEQAEASLQAYTNDDGDFAEAVRARIDDLNARIDALSIEIEIRKTMAQLNYILTKESGERPS